MTLTVMLLVLLLLSLLIVGSVYIHICVMYAFYYMLFRVRRFWKNAVVVVFVVMLNQIDISL